MPLEIFNGIDFLTGDYLTPPVSTSKLASKVLAAQRNSKEERELRWRHERDFRNRAPDRRPDPAVNPMDLSSSGWGVIVPQGTPREVLRALRPLLDHRQEQASRNVDSYYRELPYVVGESKDSFFQRYGVEEGPAHPKQLPYYLLIVGSPEVVPYRFQYLLDMQYAVGRLFFEDPDDYGRYAESVISAECGHKDVRPEVGLFSVIHPDDDATRISDQHLIQPLAKSLATRAPEWKLRVLAGEEATKSALGHLLGGGETPALLLTAAHGLGFSQDHPRQRLIQGGIICQDWPGRYHPVQSDQYFAASDITDDARFHGLIAFLFGCYSAGTPDEDNYPPDSWGQPGEPPPSKPFISSLASRLLSHPKGGALAVVGHVDRAWGCSFGREPGKGILHFESFCQQLLEGFPVGLAMDWMNERFAEMSTRLTEVLDAYKKDPLPEGERSAEDEELLADLWRANNDARNFVVLGDPAVRLATGPQIVRSPAVTELRTARGALNVPVRSHWERYVDGWLKEIETRVPPELGVDAETAVRTVRERDNSLIPAGPRGRVAARPPRASTLTKLVVDASAVLALLLGVPSAVKVAERLRKARGNLHVPHLLDVEVTGILRSYSVASPEWAERLREAVVDLQRMPVFRHSHEFLLGRVWELEGKMTTGDATYVALAEFLGAPILTFSDRLVTDQHDVPVEILSMS